MRNTKSGKQRQSKIPYPAKNVDVDVNEIKRARFLDQQEPSNMSQLNKTSGMFLFQRSLPPAQGKFGLEAAVLAAFAVTMVVGAGELAAEL